MAARKSRKRPVPLSVREVVANSTANGWHIVLYPHIDQPCRMSMRVFDDVSVEKLMVERPSAHFIYHWKADMKECQWWLDRMPASGRLKDVDDGLIAEIENRVKNRYERTKHQWPQPYINKHQELIMGIKWAKKHPESTEFDDMVSSTIIWHSQRRHQLQNDQRSAASNLICLLPSLGYDAWEKEHKDLARRLWGVFNFWNDIYRTQGVDSYQAHVRAAFRDGTDGRGRC